jgi:putative transposase
MKKMPWQAATKINLSEKEENILNQMALGTHTPLHLKTRAKIVLMASQGLSSNEIRKNLGLVHNTVKRWRDRYTNMNTELRKIEAETPQRMRSAIKKVLSDEQRPGSPSKFRDEQVAAIIAMSCEDPMKFDLPFSHWTPELLQIEVIKLGIVESISVRQIGRFFKKKEIYSHTGVNAG